jgi:hypothetical protein
LEEFFIIDAFAVGLPGVFITTVNLSLFASFCLVQRCPKINAEFDQKMAFPATLWLFA